MPKSNNFFEEKIKYRCTLWWGLTPSFGNLLCSLSTIFLSSSKLWKAIYCLHFVSFTINYMADFTQEKWQHTSQAGYTCSAQSTTKRKYRAVQWDHIDKLSNATVPNYTFITTNHKALFIYIRTEITGWFPVLPLKNVFSTVPLNSPIRAVLKVQRNGSECSFRDGTLELEIICSSSSSVV